MSNTTLESLREPFSGREIKHRVGRVFPDGMGGVLFLYVDARLCQERLDSVLGVAGWNTTMSVTHAGEGAVISCALTANIDGTTVTRTDCCGIDDQTDVKAAASTAFKRACSAFGIGRYLYGIGEIRVRLDNKRFRGTVLLPDSMLPEDEHCGRQEIAVEYPCGDYSHSQGSADGFGAPRGVARDDAEAPDDVKAALEFVVETGYYEGKPMKAVSPKGLVWLMHNSKSKAEKDAVAAVYNFRNGNGGKNGANGRSDKPAVAPAEEEVDIPF